ncbi:MAG: hypothetical protein ACLR7U_01495 [Ruthenibacterium lactatiformans]
MGDGSLQAQDVRSSFSEGESHRHAGGRRFDIRQTWGCPASTIRFEFGILPNVLIRGEGYRIPANAGGSLVAAKGELELFDGKDTVSVGPGFAVNDVIKGLFGAVPASEDRFNLYFNDVTNFDRRFSIRVK